MTNFAELMQQRISLVEKISALNSKQLLNTQIRSGVEVELMTCIETAQRHGKSEVALQRRAELEASYEEAANACLACEQELNELAEDLTSLDQQIEQLAAQAESSP